MARKTKEGTSGIRTYFFSSEDMAFLGPRQALVDDYNVIISDLDFVIKQYIVNQVFPRLSIDPKAAGVISLDIRAKSFTITKKSPVIVPEKKIIVPDGR